MVIHTFNVVLAIQHNASIYLAKIILCCFNLRYYQKFGYPGLCHFTKTDFLLFENTHYLMFQLSLINVRVIYLACESNSFCNWFPVQAVDIITSKLELNPYYISHNIFLQF